ncbi:MAG: hypothetical protein LUC98_01720 [Lachnospiraceae bacterium]|nr:hypothetical protein [Lachnospiraceae bacterium]
MIKLEELNAKAEEYAFGGAIIPHEISGPVIRMEDGNCVVAYFCYGYTYQDIQKMELRRPSEWLLLDPSTGELIAENYCQEKDFSSESFNSRYSMEDESRVDADDEWLDEMDQLFEQVRTDLVKNGGFDGETYRRYLEKLLSITPESYRVFYRELSI